MSSLNKDQVFTNNINSTLAISRDYQSNQYSYEWLDIIEGTLHYIDNILRNPKRFIVNEEEIVKVELSKKITVESVIHLTQHTNFIQDYDPKTGDVRPSKVLNINKEESLDTYENRFIFTLINNLRTFFNDRCSNLGDSFYKDKKDVSYEANTKVGTEDVKISLQISSLDQDKKSVNSGGLSIEERIANTKIQLDGFMGTELMQTLAKLHVPPVRSPIRKTNVILKNPNFKKAEELWNYIQTYVSKDSCINENNNYYDNSDLKNQFDYTFLLDYLALNNIGNNEENSTSFKELAINSFNKAIENILDSNITLSEEELTKMFVNEVRSIKKRLENDGNELVNLFTNAFKEENEKRINLIKQLECGE